MLLVPAGSDNFSAIATPMILKSDNSAGKGARLQESPQRQLQLWVAEVERHFPSQLREVRKAVDV